MLPTCRMRSYYGWIRAGHLAGFFPCLHCGWKTMRERVPDPRPSHHPPLLPGLEGAALRCWRKREMQRFCSSPALPMTLKKEITKLSQQ